MAVGNFIYVGKSRLRRKFKRKKYSLDNTPKRKPAKHPQPQQLGDGGGTDQGYQPLLHGDDVLHLAQEDSCLQDHGGKHNCRYCISESASISSGYSSDSDDLLPRVELDFVELRPRVSFHTMLPFRCGKTKPCEILTGEVNFDFNKVNFDFNNNGDAREGREGTEEGEGVEEYREEEVMEEIQLVDNESETFEDMSEKDVDMEIPGDEDSVLGNEDEEHVESTGSDCLLAAVDVALTPEPAPTPKKKPGHFFNREVFQDKEPKTWKSFLCCLGL